MAAKPKKDAKKATDPNLDNLETTSNAGAGAESSVSEGGAVDAATVAAMMAQMQALMAEVTELRAQVGSNQGAPVTEEPEEEEAVPERFGAVLREMEEGIEDEDDSPSDVSKEETAQLLAGLDRSLAEDVAGAPESVVEETSEPIAETDADDMTDDNIAQLLEAAAQEVVSDEDFDWEEDPNRKPFESANGAEITNEELEAMLAQVQATGEDVVEGELGQVAPAEAAEPEPAAEAEPQVVEEPVPVAEVDTPVVASDEDDLNDETIARLISEAAQIEVSDEDFDWEEDPDKRPFESANGAELTNEQLSAMIAQVQATGEDVVEGEELAGAAQEASSPEAGVPEVKAEVAEEPKIEAPVVEAPVEAKADDVSDAVLGADDIAALLAQAQEKAEENQTDLGVLGEDDEEEEEMLSLEELAELVREQIALQNAPDQSQPVVQEVSNGAEWIPKPEPTKDAGGGVLSAEEIAALLAEPDPEGQYVPSESEAMDDDEIAQLLADAQNQQIEGVSLGSDLGDPAPKASDLDDVEEPVAQTSETVEATDEPTEDAPKPATVRAAKPTGEGPDLAAVKLVPAHAAIRAMAVPYGFEEGKLVCRTAEPVDDEAIQWISDAVGLDVICEPYPILDVVADLRRLYSDLNEEHAFLTLKAVTEQKPKFADVVKSVLRRIA